MADWSACSETDAMDQQTHGAPLLSPWATNTPLQIIQPLSNTVEVYTSICNKVIQIKRISKVRRISKGDIALSLPLERKGEKKTLVLLNYLKLQ